MTNRTLIPALRAHVGDWQYYICVMKYAQAAREINFAFELEPKNDLSRLIQRGLTKRTEGIVQYLKGNEHRFLGALIVAAWGGAPQYMPVEMQDGDGLLSDLDDTFGVLTFDGAQQYFALDGQHRLRAIKDVLKEDPSLGDEEIAVILVSHFDSEEGRQRTRRLFTNINKNAKSTTKAENIALDEDDAFAILARRLVREHEFYSIDGRVEVLKNSKGDGDLSLAGAQVGKTHKTAFSTLQTLYEIIKLLAWHTTVDEVQVTQRPSDEELEVAYDIIVERLDSLVSACGESRKQLESVADARDIRAPKDAEGKGHAFLRPVIQREVAKLCRDTAGEEILEFKVLLVRLSDLSWKIQDAPWSSVAIVKADGGIKMVVNNQSRQLLGDLLRAHVCPESKAEIKRARAEFKAQRGDSYPVSEAELSKRIVRDA